MDDCVTCVIAMVTGYSYERVLDDASRYQQTIDGKYFEWWPAYLRDEGFDVFLRSFGETCDFRREASGTVGILGMTIPRFRMRHVAVIDALGVADPAGDFPERLPLDEYVASRLPQGFIFDADFLKISARPPLRAGMINQLTRHFRRSN